MNSIRRQRKLQRARHHKLRDRRRLAKCCIQCAEPLEFEPPLREDGEPVGARCEECKRENRERENKLDGALPFCDRDLDVGAVAGSPQVRVDKTADSAARPPSRSSTEKGYR